VSSLFATTAQAESLPTEVIEIMDQHRIALYLSASQVNSIPEWHPGQGKPPMSLEGAVERAMKWIANDPSLAGAEVYEIKYKPVHHYEKLNRWYYLVELRQAAGKKRFLAVLPDGQVVSAIEEPGS
jgi:hypothetical protein